MNLIFGIDEKFFQDYERQYLTEQFRKLTAEERQSYFFETKTHEHLSKVYAWIMENDREGYEQRLTSGMSYYDEYEIGDVVVLKSGGPCMTIIKAGYDTQCQWFDGDSLQSGCFDKAQLIKV